MADAVPIPGGPVLQVPSSIDYTSKDFTAFMESMYAYAAEAMPDWQPGSEGDFGVLLLECLAYVLDILSYYGDRAAQEAYIGTATQRLSLLHIAALLGYVPSNGTPAAGTVTFQTESATPQTTIPAGTQVSTAFTMSLDAPVIYETDQTVICPADGGTVTAAVTQGETYSMVTIGTASGQPGQSLQLPQTSVLTGTVAVYVTGTLGPVQWTQVPALGDAGASDRVFSASVDASGNTWVTFGDGTNGMIPTAGLTVSATYRVGAGQAGNTAAGTVGTLVSPVDGVYVPFLADGVTYSSSAMTGGADPETNDQIRTLAPQAFQAAGRAVNPADFEALAAAVPGVSAVSAVAGHSTSVSLFVLGPDYQAPGAQLQQDILAAFTGKTLAGVTVSVAEPALIRIDVGTASNPVVLAVRDNYVQSTVEAAVVAALTELFQPPAAAFGQYLTVGSVYTAIMSVPGVSYAVVPVMAREDVPQSGTAPVQLRGSEIATPGVFTITPTGGIT